MLTIQIHNDGTGKDNIDNYVYKVYINKNCIEKGRVESHDRKRGWRELVRKLVNEAEDIENKDMLAFKEILECFDNITFNLESTKGIK